MPDLLNASQAAKLLGVTTSTIMRWVDLNRFPNAYRIERTVRIPAADIEALKQRPGKAAS